MKYFKKLVAAFLFLLTITACQSDLEQGQESMLGSWSVESVYSSYPARGSTDQIQVHQENGPYGSFVFDESMVSYNFTRNDTIYSDTTTWALTSERVNSGFTKVIQFTLSMGNDLILDCRFGNSTKNAEKDANQVTLSNATMVDVNEEMYYELALTK